MHMPDIPIPMFGDLFPTFRFHRAGIVQQKDPLPGDSPMMKMSPTVMEQWVTRLYPHSHLPPGPGGAKVG